MSTATASIRETLLRKVRILPPDYCPKVLQYIETLEDDCEVALLPKGGARTTCGQNQHPYRTLHECHFHTETTVKSAVSRKARYALCR